MAEQLSDEEQLQVLKNWWKENGTSLLAIIVIAAGSYFGWQWWNNYQRDYAEGAAAVYEEMLTTLQVTQDEPLSDEKRSTAEFLISQLQNDYNKTQYAVNASLYGAKLAVENNQLDKAAENLNWIIDQRDDESDTLARLRLARVLFAQEKYTEALALVDYAGNDQFTPLFADIKGDLLVATGDNAAAISAYQQAFESADEQSNNFRRIVEVKLIDLANLENE